MTFRQACGGALFYGPGVDDGVDGWCVSVQGGTNACGCRLIVPWHPERRIAADVFDEPAYRCEIMEGVLSDEPAGLNDAHEEVADPRAMKRFVEQ